MHPLLKLAGIGLFLLPAGACQRSFIADASSRLSAAAAPQPVYNEAIDWAAHPWKQDPSDSVPLPLRSESRDTTADVFFIHPTTYTGRRKKGEEWNARLDNAKLNKKTDASAIRYQASAFNQHARVFAPRYRQAHLAAFFLKDVALKSSVFDTAYADVKAAFQYYLSHYNGGRPIIIAAHSQGTVHAARLLKEFFENKPLHRQLVCAYLVGMPIPWHYFSELAPCKNATASGCFVSWRTFQKGYEPPPTNPDEQDSIYCTNPLTWTITENYAPARLHEGSVLYRFNRIVYTKLDAQVHRGILWVCKPRFPGRFFVHTKNYHIGDINLFYINIRHNVEKRLASWKEN